MKKYPLFLFLSSLVVGFTACDDDDDFDIPTTQLTITADNVNANDTSGDATRGRWEMPRLTPAYDYITHSTSDGQLNYALEYCKEKYHSHWVAYRYDSNLKKQNTSRSDQWGAEPYYNSDKKWQVATGELFRGYNRGHLVGSAERLYSVEANVQTFYMSNMSPMLSAFNTTYWGEIEDLVRDKWGRKVAAGDTLYVVKGGTIDDDKIKPTRVTVKNTLGENVDVVVPQYYFIACLLREANGDCKAIGFYLEHKDYRNQTAAFLKEMRQGAACTIDELEAKTGIDFFCNLPDWLENYVEAHTTLSAWAGL